jgi:hypothetical protein
MRIDYRWSAGDAERIRKSVADIVALSPGIILAAGGRNMTVLQQADTVEGDTRVPYIPQGLLLSANAPPNWRSIHHKPRPK